MKNLGLTIFFVSTLILVQSCSKKRGCNDKDACNFDSTAEKYDGSCIYNITWYKDDNGDGYGDPNITLNQCEQPSGYADKADGGYGVSADFTAVDCDGVTHNLYNELDANKIIVIAWVMPCSSCITDPVDALNIVQSYSSTHPGRISFYLADDYADQDCATIDGWASWYGLSSATSFSDPNLTMVNYGVGGMPKIVVIAGANHFIYFNKNETTVGFKDAIDQALADNP